MPSLPHPSRVFTTAEIDTLGRTADALTAYMGKPVVAEVICLDETGFECVIFAIPLQPDDDISDITPVQVGGPEARILGNQGGLNISDGAYYECQFLWAIQLSDIEGVRFIKVDSEGDEVAWSDSLETMLPFALTDPPPPDEDDPDPIYGDPSDTVH